MNLFSGLLGYASEIDIKEREKEIAPILIEGETIQRCYKVIRDLYLFTDKRLILIDKKGVTGKQTEYHSIPYKNISHFSTETAGYLDLDSDFKIWILGSALPVVKKFKKSTDIQSIQRELASFVLHCK